MRAAGKTYDEIGRRDSQTGKPIGSKHAALRGRDPTRLSASRRERSVREEERATSFRGSACP